MKTLAKFLLIVVCAHFASAADPVTLADLADDYYFGDGTGVNCSLTVTARGEFRFEWQGCLGTYDKNDGPARLENGVLQLAPRKPNPRDGFRGTPTEFYPVRWGPRLYLIPTEQIVAFCSHVNQGLEPRTEIHGSYYLRRSDEKKPAKGRPSVPEHWNQFFLDTPVRGRITKLLGTQEGWLNKGAADGLLAGMILTAQQHGKLLFSQVRVEAVEKDRCRIKCAWKDSELAVGQAVSSRFHE